MSIVDGGGRSIWFAVPWLLAWILRMALAFELLVQAGSVFGMGKRMGTVELTPMLSFDPYVLASGIAFLAIMLLWSRTTTFAAILLIPSIGVALSMRNEIDQSIAVISVLHALGVAFLLFHDRRRFAALFAD